MGKIKLKNRKALVVYDNKDDFEKNQTFALSLIKELQKKKLNAEVLLLENKDINFEAKINEAELILNRSRKVDFLKTNNQINTFLVNPFNVVFIANDKYETYKWLKQNRFLTVNSSLLSKETIKSFPAIVKKRNSHGGKDVHLVNSADEIKHLNIENATEWIVQPFLSIGTVEYRAYILFGKIIKVIKKISNANQFKANFSQGAEVSLFKLKWFTKRKIKKIAKRLREGYYAIDFFLNRYNRVIVNEIEDAAGARALVQLCPDLNITKIIIRTIISKFKKFLKKKLIS
ncbi:ATP-grasp domain-containing protein [Mycoplasmoides genitalium]|uniref:ATP-grasp domain-containing protein n=1 Tax=Mycoplasmoides genitalium TaxID=2097 RepID=UPI00027B3183|nr:ATP-grasp domain-containing protein [Mycoplasmoides genitalium]AFQ04314.1 hypothetical protein CM5_00055 [Mycoplasmoides genitalium M2288]